MADLQDPGLQSQESASRNAALQQQRVIAARLAAAQQQQSIIAQAQAQEAAEQTEVAAGTQQIQALLASTSKLRKEASLSYIGPYLLLLVAAPVLDLIGLVPILGLAAKFLLTPLYTGLRWLILWYYDKPSGEELQQRVYKTIGTGFLGATLPVHTAFMVHEWLDKRQRVNAAASKLRGVNAQITAIQRSLPR